MPNFHKKIKANFLNFLIVLVLSTQLVVTTNTQSEYIRLGKCMLILKIPKQISILSRKLVCNPENMFQMKTICHQENVSVIKPVGPWFLVYGHKLFIYIWLHKCVFVFVIFYLLYWTDKIIDHKVFHKITNVQQLICMAIFRYEYKTIAL